MVMIEPLLLIAVAIGLAFAGGWGLHFLIDYIIERTKDRR